MAVINRFNKTLRGAMLITGNTMQLSKIDQQLAPGTFDSGGCIVATDVSLTTPAAWVSVVSLPAGNNVSLDWNKGSAKAYLSIPSTANVVYAELFWSGVAVNGGGGPIIDVTSSLGNAVTLIPPGGGPLTISPATLTAQNFTVSSNVNYVRSADITTIVNTALRSGFYVVGSIPTALNPLDDFANCSGWNIIVVYELSSEKYRNLNVYALGDGVSASSGPNPGQTVTLPITGFNTPSGGNVGARCLISATEGDPNKNGDRVRFVIPASNVYVTLSGPNNPENNFFQSQINNNQGLLDTMGTFGDRNSPISQGSVGFAARQGYDVTNVDASAAFTINQNSTTLVLSTDTDGYNPVSIGIQIDANEPLIFPVKTVDLGTANIGTTLTYQVAFKNIGNIFAYDATFIDTIPNGTTFIANSVVVNGSSQSGADPATGISLGTIAQNQAFTITYQVKVVSSPNPNPIPNFGTVNYDFIGIPGQPTVTAVQMSNTVLTTVPLPNVSLNKNVNKTVAAIGDVLNYTIVISNTGNVSADSPVFFDTIPNGTTLIPNSFTVNGASVPGNPNTGISISNIGANGVVTVAFAVTIANSPNPNPIPNFSDLTYQYQSGSGPVNDRKTSNIVYTQVNGANLSGITKYRDKGYAKCGEDIKYTIAIPNTGNISAFNVKFIDTIPNGTTLVANSVTLNGATLAGTTPAPPNGINIGTIANGATSTVTFSVTINCS